MLVGFCGLGGRRCLFLLISGFGVAIPLRDTFYGRSSTCRLDALIECDVICVGWVLGFVYY